MRVLASAVAAQLSESERGGVEGDKVTLRGRVRSAFEREEAERAAWRAPGVHSVDNRIVVGEFAAAA